MRKVIIQTANAPAAIGPYSQAVEAGPFVFCSGQIALSADATKEIPIEIRAQTEQCMKNIEAVLTAANLTLAHVVKTTIFVTSMGDFAAVNEIYGQYFTEAPPARSTVQVAGLPRGVNVEIEVLAFRG